jgi:plasmid stabilization system protein ParE
MPAFAVEVHPLAADEAEAAERWYRDRNETAATRFRRELDRAVGLIAERPDAAPPYRRQHQTLFAAAVPFLRRLSGVQPACPSRRGCTRSTKTALLASALRPVHDQELWNYVGPPALLHAGPPAGVDAAPQRNGFALDSCTFARRLASNVRGGFCRFLLRSEVCRCDTTAWIDWTRA